MIKKISSKLKLILVFLFISLSFLLYKDSFSSYFFQDDWFSFKISKAQSLTNIVHFFIPRTDVIYYKPLGMQLPFFLLSSLFGINPLPFHILAFITHIINIIGLFLLIQILIKRDDIALLTSFLYATAPIHFTQFYWPAAYSFIAGPATFIYSFYLFLFFLNSQKRRFYVLSFGLFSLGLFTNEMVIVVPIILSLYLIIMDQKKYLKFTYIYFFVAFLLIITRLTLFSPPTSGSYQLSFGKHILLNLQAYILWSLGLPEEIKAQFISFGKLNPQFIADFHPFILVFVMTFFINILFFIVFPIFIHNRKTQPLLLKDSLFSLAWFLCGLLPVIAFPKHTFTYFLAIPAIGLYYLFSFYLTLFLDRIYQTKHIIALAILIIISINWLVVSYATIRFNQLVYWAPRRAKIAKNLVDQVKVKYPYFPNGKVIYVYDNSENRLALNDQDAFQVIYHNNLIKTIYTSSVSSNHFLAQ